METMGVLLLAVIAYFLWKIYNQREQEKNEVKTKEYFDKKERQEKDRQEKYPHLVGKIEESWLRLFADQAERGAPLLKMAWMLMLQGSVKIDLSEGSMKWDSLWDTSEELLEHLEKYHEGSTTAHEIALCTYWQIAAEAIEKLIEESPTKEMRSGRSSYTSEIEGEKLEVAPFTDIDKIAALFPKKANHPHKEISFFDERGSFPRKSKGSPMIKDKLKSLGL